MASTRRTLLATLLGAGAACLVRPHQAAASVTLRLPETPLHLERQLERGVGENGVIRVRRRWEVFFERQGRGIALSGRQIAAEVSAPPHLAQLAQIEQQRDTSAMFPLLLGEDGTILITGDAAASEDAINTTLRMAEAMIARQPMPGDERERLRYYLAQVHGAGTNLLEVLPPDLFFPRGAPTRMSDTVTLPDGLVGRFALTYAARAQADAPWLARAERRIESEVGGMVRAASEVWSLNPA